jgi:hypothetical protein
MQITQEVVKSDAKVDKSVEKDTKNIKTEGKTMEKAPKSLEEQAKDMRADGTMKEQIEKFKGKGKDKGKKNKATNPKTEEVTTVSDVRSKAEATLVKVCKDLKLDAPTRINAKVGSKIGVGALQARNNLGFLKAAVRATDVCLYTPYSIVKIGRPEPNKVSYPHVTLVNATDPGLAKAFERALKDKKSSSEWATELGAVSKSQVRGKTAKENLANQKAALEARLAAVNKRLKDEAKEQAKTTKVAKPKKPKATASPAIEKVAAEVA